MFSLLLSACGANEECNVDLSPSISIQLYQSNGEPLFDFPEYPTSDDNLSEKIGAWNLEVEEIQSRMAESVSIEYSHSSGAEGVAALFSDVWWILQQEDTGTYELSIVYHERLNNGCSKIARAERSVRKSKSFRGCSTEQLYVPLDVMMVCE